MARKKAPPARRPLVQPHLGRGPGESLLIMHGAVGEIDLLPFIRDFILAEEPQALVTIDTLAQFRDAFRLRDDGDKDFKVRLAAYLDQQLAATGWDERAAVYDAQYPAKK